jgi:hypothetical protein
LANRKLLLLVNIKVKQYQMILKFWQQNPKKKKKKKKKKGKKEKKKKKKKNLWPN